MRPANMVVLAVMASMAMSGGAHASPVLLPEVIVDGDVDSNVGESAIDRRRDEWSVQIDGTQFSSVVVAFGSGIQMRSLPTLTRRRLIGQLFVTTVSDPVIGLDTEDDPSDQTPTTTGYSVRLPSGRHPRSATLDVAGGGAIRAVWRRGSRAVAISGLPEGAVRVEFHTAGAVGVDLLSLSARCRHDDRLAGARVTARTAGGSLNAPVPPSRRDRCGSLPGVS